MVLDGRYSSINILSQMRDQFKDIKFVRQEYKSKASDEPGERSNKIIMTEIDKQDTTCLLPGDVKSVRHAIYKRRRKTQQKLPKSRAESHEALDQYDAFSSQMQ